MARMPIMAVARLGYRLLPKPARLLAREAYHRAKSAFPNDIAKLVRLIEAGGPLDTLRGADLGHKIERGFSELQHGVADHSAIGQAIFARSAELYRGHLLPSYLRRYTYPAFLGIAMNTHCNAACFFCRSESYKGASIDFEKTEKLRSAIKNARAIDLTGWGEPFLYHRFDDVLRYVLSVNDSPHNISLTSNGSLLSRKWGALLRGHINRLVLSVNAASEESYEAQMRYKSDKFTLEKTVRAISDFMEEITEADRARITLHMVCNTDNFREISSFVEMAARLNIKSVNIGNFICADKAHINKTLWNVKEAYNKELTNAEWRGLRLGVTVSGRKFFVDERKVMGADICVAPFEAFYVETSGTTAPCCFAGRDRLGNAYQEGFDAVWFSDQYNRLRTSRHLDACKVCTVFTPFDDETAHKSAYLTT